MSTDGVKSIVDDAMEPLNQLELPEQLENLVARHHRSVMSLAKCLMSGGKTDDEVRSAIKLVCGSFESELFNTIRAFADNGKFNVK